MFTLCEVYRQLADDVLTGKFCEESLSLNQKRDALTRILFDVYLKGWDDKTIDTYKEG